MAYEFSEEQEHTIAKLAGSMSTVGSFMIFLALLGVAVIVTMAVQLQPILAHPELSPKFLQAIGLPLVVPAVNVLILLIFGSLTRRASVFFRKIAETEGQDIEHLMRAIGSLRTLYGLQYTIILIAIILTILVIAGLGYLIFA